MKTWLVICGHRTDDGLNYSLPTAWRTVEVDAPDEAAARLASIDAVYKEVGMCCSHVRPLRVVEIVRCKV